MTEFWPAPVADGPIDARVTVPGSKSITNRALVLAALAIGPSEIRGPLRSRDTELMADALRSLGVTVEDEPDGTWRVRPTTLRGPANVDCGLAGTVMRFVPPLAALADGRVDFDGDPRARMRPLDTVLNALRQLGADVRGSALPFEIHGQGAVSGGKITMDASASSQFVSGLLLSAPRFEQGVSIEHVGPPMPSLPHVAMTTGMLGEVGVMVDESEPDRWHVSSGEIAPLDMDVEPDLSNAAPFLAAAAATGGRVMVAGWPHRTTQAGDAIREILRRMDAEVRLDASGLTVIGPERLAPIDVDLHEVGELTPTVAALAALADGDSCLRGIEHLRGHETDRLRALRNELSALGGEVEETGDGLLIKSRPLRAGRWHSYADHRMATAGAILGLRVAGVEIDDIATTAKTLPDFPRMWAAMLEQVD